MPPPTTTGGLGATAAAPGQPRSVPGHGPVPTDGEGPVSMVELPLPTGAIGEPPVRRRSGVSTSGSAESEPERPRAILPNSVIRYHISELLPYQPRVRGSDTMVK